MRPPLGRKRNSLARSRSGSSDSGHSLLIQTPSNTCGNECRRCPGGACGPAQSSSDAEVASCCSGDSSGLLASITVSNFDIEIGSYHSNDTLPCTQDAPLSKGSLWANMLNEQKVRMSATPLYETFVETKQPMQQKKGSSRQQREEKPLDRVHFALYLFFMATVVFLGCCGCICLLYKDCFLSTLWCPNGLCMVWLIIWSVNWENVVAIVAAYITASIWASAMIFNSAPYRVLMVYMGCSLVQNLIGTVGLVLWCGKEIRSFNPRYILTFKTFFIITLVVAIAGPLAQAVLLTTLEYEFLRDNFFHQSNSPRDIIFVWALASSAGTVTTLYVGIVLLATCGEFMLKQFGHARIKRRKAMRHVYVRTIRAMKKMLRANSMLIFRKGSLLVALALVSFVSNFYVQIGDCQLDARMGLLFAPVTTLVAWIYPPIVSVFFQLYFSTAMSSLLNMVHLRCGYTYFFYNSADVFMCQLVLLLTSYFIIVSSKIVELNER